MRNRLTITLQTPRRSPWFALQLEIDEEGHTEWCGLKGVPRVGKEYHLKKLA